MTGAVVVASHLPGGGHFKSSRFGVRGVECGDDFDYWRGLYDQWVAGLVIVNVEHDMDVTDAHVQALLDCPHQLCSWAYVCHWVTTHLSHDIYAAGAGKRARDSDGGCVDYLQGGEEWANWSAIGFVKITPRARIGRLRREPWSLLELAVESAVARPWHMHWNTPSLPPVVHHHW